MKSIYGWILALTLIVCVIAAGCTDEEPPAPVPGGGSPQQPGVLIRHIGNVTGQGVILQGVPRGTIDTITFTIGLAPGAKSLDLDNMTIAYADAVRSEILTPVKGYRGIPPQGYWGVVDAINELGTPNMRLDYEEQLVIRINPKAPVVSDQVVTISVKPPVGKPLILRVVAPAEISETDNILRGL
ncbi:MAG: flagellin [Methanoregula sp.]|jgi:archaellin|nr:flagellin [Methanoregula sp.]